MNTVYCPVKKNEIDGDDCYLLCAIADHEISDRVLPDGILEWNEIQRQKCLKCKYHEVISPSDEE